MGYHHLPHTVASLLPPEPLLDPQTGAPPDSTHAQSLTLRLRLWGHLLLLPLLWLLLSISSTEIAGCNLITFTTDMWKKPSSAEAPWVQRSHVRCTRTRRAWDFHGSDKGRGWGVGYCTRIEASRSGRTDFGFRRYVGFGLG